MHKYIGMSAVLQKKNLQAIVDCKLNTSQQHNTVVKRKLTAGRDSLTEVLYTSEVSEHW